MEEQPNVLLIRFPDLLPAEANRAAAVLEQQLHSLTGGQVSPEVRKEHADTQDAGSVLAIVLGAEAIVVFADQIARGISSYLQCLNSRIEIVTDQGKVIVSGEAAAGFDAAAVTAALKSGVARPSPQG